MAYAVALPPAKPTEPRAARVFADARSPASPRDDFSREVYCVLGIPIDALDMAMLLRAVDDAVGNNTPLLISTANLNFLITSQLDPEFRETLLLSELCPADGIAIVWIARLLGLPIGSRVAGSDMLEILAHEQRSARPLTVFLFGGADGAAEAAAKNLNRGPGGLRCVGTLNPGFGTVEDMSQDHIIDKINASGAGFLIAALGAKKGQSWLARNHDRLQIPIRAHLGASINFAAGTVRRAPAGVRKLGLEWLWRIKEEPYLWRRYWNDGATVLGLLLTCVLPLLVRARWQRLRGGGHQDLVIECERDHKSVTLALCGAATTRNVDKATAAFRAAAAAKMTIRINLSGVSVIDARFLGLLLMLRKRARKHGNDMKFIDVPARLQRIFRLNRVGFLLALDEAA